MLISSTALPLYFALWPSQNLYGPVKKQSYRASTATSAQIVAAATVGTKMRLSLTAGRAGRGGQTVLGRARQHHRAASNVTVIVFLLLA